MTKGSPEIPNSLVERLRKTESSGSCIQTGVTTCWYRNPDGPEAADRILTLESEAAEAYWLINQVGQEACRGPDYARALAVFRRARQALEPQAMTDAATLAEEQLVRLGYSGGYEEYRNKWIGDHEEMIADLVRWFVPRRLEPVILQEEQEVREMGVAPASQTPGHSDEPASGLAAIAGSVPNALERWRSERPIRSAYDNERQFDAAVLGWQRRKP